VAEISGWAWEQRAGAVDSGFARFGSKIVPAETLIVPTIIVVDDTFDRFCEVMADLILQARQRAKIA
jgi:hypothetical protein